MGLMDIRDVGDGLIRRASDSQKSTSTSASAFLTTLIPALVSAVVMVLVFIIVRKREFRMYQPRTYIGSLRPWERTPRSPTGFFNWITAMFKLPDTYVLQHHSLDAYLLIRFLKLISMICLVGCCITMPVLWPVNATGDQDNQQFDMLSISNVKISVGRYFAHAFVSMIFISFVFYTITRETIFYINLRQAYFFSPSYASRVSARTVLFTTVPQNYLSHEKIKTMFGRDKVKNVWLATDTKELVKKVEARDGAAMKLEAAETKLIKLATKAHQKTLEKQAKEAKKAAKKGHSQTEDIGLTDISPAAEPDDESGSVAARYIEPKQRPQHRLKMLIGKKVDTINWARSEIERLNPEIEELQAKHRSGDVRLISSVFVEFYAQTDAQLAYQSVAHNQALHMAPRYIGLEPTQVIWSNLRIKWWERTIRYTGTVALVIALIIFWAIPTAVVGAISNIDNLTNMVPFLKFIEHVPPWIKGVITGLLPSVLMAVLMAMVPIFFRFMAKIGGAPTLAVVEMTCQNYYFAFQVIQVFLVVTIASSATTVVTKIIKEPQSAANLLATNIPKASNFYISYITLQGLSFASGTLLQIAGLILGKVLGAVLDTTPRKMYTRWSTMAGLGWGTVYPAFTLLAVVSITYSCIQPLVLGFASIALFLFYFAYRYNVLYVSNTYIDTQGKVFVQGLQHLTVGCYLLIVCLIGLFAIGTANGKVAIGPLVLEIIFLVFLVLYHVSLKSAMRPLVNYLPKNLEAEEEALLSQENPKLGNGKSEDPFTIAPSHSGQDGLDGASTTVDSAEKGMANGNGNGNLAAPPPMKGNFLTRFLRPDIYADYESLRKLVPTGHAATEYPPEIERDAYLHPSVKEPVPQLWIPRDQLGVSTQEVMHTSKVIPITDEEAWLDDKGKLRWDMEKGQPPIYQEKIYF